MDEAFTNACEGKQMTLDEKQFCNDVSISVNPMIVCDSNIYLIGICFIN